MTSHSFSCAAALAAASLCALAIAGSDTVSAQPIPASAPNGDEPAVLGRLRSQVELQTTRLDDQDRRLREQEAVIENLRRELDALRLQGAGGQAPPQMATMRMTQPKPPPRPPEPVQALEAARAAGVTPGSLQSASVTTAIRPNAQADVQYAQETVAATPGPSLPDRPVGEAPQPTTSMADITALPEGVRVLTTTGSLIAETSVEYDRTSSNRLVFRGVEIVPGIQLGLVDANDVARDTAVGTVDLRYGIFDRVEVEARIPYFYRHDRLTVLSQQVSATVPAATQTTSLEGNHLGDIEFAARYQINRALQGGPIYVAGIRVKSTTGIGPYDVNFDSNGVATSLGTGSGFWAAEPSITMLFPSDPVVIFANIGYLHSFRRDIDKEIGTTHVGEVEPGDAFDLSLGFGFSLNPQFSFSLGFSNTYILATRMELGTTVQHSDPLEAGSLTMGWSYVLSPTLTLSNNFEFGMTSDAPDMRVLVRVPYRF